MKKMALFAVMFGIVCAGLFSGCTKQEEPAASPSMSPATNAPAAAPMATNAPAH